MEEEKFTIDQMVLHYPSISVSSKEQMEVSKSNFYMTVKLNKDQTLNKTFFKKLLEKMKKDGLKFGDQPELDLKDMKL